MFVAQAIGQALQTAFSMFWEVLRPLAIGFLISAIVQSVGLEESGGVSWVATRPHG